MARAERERALASPRPMRRFPQALGTIHGDRIPVRRRELQFAREDAQSFGALHASLLVIGVTPLGTV
jgi:hypothetical protein